MVRIYLGSSFSVFFPLASVLPIQKPVRFFFRFVDLVVCGFLVWSNYVSAAVAAVIMYRSTAVDERFEPFLLRFFFFFRFVFVFFWGG